MSLKPEEVQPVRLAEHFHRGRRARPAAGEILILCPHTRSPVTTGLSIDCVVFKSLPPVAVPLRCPACGQTHRWKPGDAWINVDA
jgi:hypothetical protein